MNPAQVNRRIQDFLRDLADEGTGSNQVVWVKAHVEDWIESKIAAAL